MLEIKITDCGTNMDQNKGYFVDMYMEIFPMTLIASDKLIKIQEYVIHQEHKKLFTYLAENVK